MSDRQPIDPALRQYLDEGARISPGPVQSPADARARMLRQLEGRGAAFARTNGVTRRDLTLRPALIARLYTPVVVAGSLPVLVYLHGGGWVAGSVATHDPFCSLLCEASGLLVLSVDYRLAPEHPYPAGLEDALFAVGWAARHAGEFGGDPERVVLGGDSSGANLAAAAANRLATGLDGPKLAAQVLLYPVTDLPDAGHASWRENAAGYGLEAPLMRWYWEQYAPGASPADVNVSPLRLQNVPPLPPTLVATAEYDLLRDEGVAYANRLAAVGVAVTHLHAPDMHHNFAVGPGTVVRFPQSREALGQFAAWLRGVV